MSTRTVPRLPRRRFFVGMAGLAIAVALAGFSKTFFLPLARGTFVPLPAAYVHAALMFSWLLLFALQASLIRMRAHALHRKLGWLGVALAAGIAWSTVAMGVQAMQRDALLHPGPGAASSLVGNCTAMLGFVAMVFAGACYRRRPDVHKRLMMLATIGVLWPAWFRFRHFFPSVPFPEWVFAILAADSLVLVLAWHDWRTFGRVHRVTAWVGGALITDHVVETLAFDSAGWRVLANGLARALA
ncbi:MAG: hypothetical protein QM719_12750 [Thermomonas sp.]